MKSAAFFFAASLLASLMVIPVYGAVNHSGTHFLATPALVADGNPRPPLPPPLAVALDNAPIVADGNPRPPLPPPISATLSDATANFDGNPRPPLPPPASGVSS
jgi:hypothetical protein